MAGRTLKPKDQRRNRHAPQRGEWVYLEDPKEPVLPELPRRQRGSGPWHPRTVVAWSFWRRDPATTQFGPAEVMAIFDLAYVHSEACYGREKWAEVRLRMDGLGLSAKGKRDLRWRAPTETLPEDEALGRPARAAEVRQLRAV